MIIKSATDEELTLGKSYIAAIEAAGDQIRLVQGKLQNQLIDSMEASKQMCAAGDDMLEAVIKFQALGTTPKFDQD